MCKKKVMIIVPGWPNNFQPHMMPFFYEQIKNLSKQNFNIEYHVVVTLSIWYIIKNIFKGKKFEILNLKKIKSENVIVKSVIYFSIPRGKFKLLSNNILYLTLINRIKLKEHDFDLIHAHFFQCARIANKIYRKFKINYIYTEHSSNYKKYLKHYKKSVLSTVSQQAKYVIAVSPMLSNQIEETLELSDFSLTVIPNGIDTEKFKINTKKEIKAINKFLFIGHLIERKGVKNLLIAFKDSIELDNKITLSIVGNGPLFKWCSDFIDQYSLKSRIKLLGTFDNEELPEIINNHDAFVLPSEKESFGVVVAEAASCGLPCISTKCGGPEYIIIKESQGILIEVPVDKSILKEAILRMSKNINSNFYNSYSIRENIVNRFSWKVVTKKIHQIYNNIN